MRKGQAAPRSITQGLRAKAWWVLRKNRTMTLAELQLTVCDGSEKCAGNNLRRWLNQLVSAGLVTRALEPDGILTSNGSYRYTLIQDWARKRRWFGYQSAQCLTPTAELQCRSAWHRIVISPITKRTDYE